MSFQGGPLSLIGSNVVSLGTGAASIAASQAAGNLWKGSGQTFIGQAGQGLAGGLAGSAVNFALNSAFSTSVVGPQGLSLDSGANFLASTITPQVTSAAAAGINQQIQQTLQKAGPFGTLLSTVGTGLVNQAFNGLTNSIFGASSAGTTENYKMFPGGGNNEASADYGGSAYTLSDVVFSIQPANQGPQSFGDISYGIPLSQTSLPWGTLNGDVFGVGSPGSVRDIQKSVMQGNFQADLTNLSRSSG